MADIRTSPRQSHMVKVQLADGRIAEGELISFAKYSSAFFAGGTCIELQIESSGRFSHESHNYFDALVSLREELEPLQMKLLCFGARKDVWASGMQRDMGAGLRAYLLSDPSEGRKPEQSIFDYAPPETIGTVEEQRTFANDWANTERQNRGEA